jgi:hypothetical protein
MNNIFDKYSELIKRLKSILWRAGGFGFVSALNEINTIVGGSDFSPEFIVVTGLIVGEITKYVNNKFGLKK